MRMVGLTVLMIMLWGAVALAAEQQPQQGPGGQGPPQESFDACTGLGDGDPCSFTSPMGEMEGACITVGDMPIHCRPEGAPGPGQGQQPGMQQPGNRQGPGGQGPPPEAYEACNGLSLNDPCSMTNPEGIEMAGMCENPPNDPDSLACRPEGMPPGQPGQGQPPQQ